MGMGLKSHIHLRELMPMDPASNSLSQSLRHVKCEAPVVLYAVSR